MQTNTEIIKQHFKKSIDKYNSNAVVQKDMARELVNLLTINDFEKVLELGSGTGFLTEQLSENIKFKEYWTNDLVEKSEMFVKQYIPDAKFFDGDFRKINFDSKFDLIASNAVFQWFCDFSEIVKLCTNLLNSGGTLIFSTFLPDNFEEIRQICGLALDYLTEKELKDILEKEFDVLKTESRKTILTFDNPLKVLTHMKNTGVNSLSDEVWSISKIKDFCAEYQNKFPNLQLTYSYILIAAKLKN